jgi:hypothetical protein
MLMETIHFIGDYIPPIAIISTQNLVEEWFEDLPTGYLLAKLDTGYFNNKLALEYICHFQH